jgi:DNA-directed RNA polymerase subunit RPC12/RpoP
MEYEALIAGLIIFIFLFYGIFLFFIIRRWRGKKGMFKVWEEEEKGEREKFLKELEEKVSLKKGERSAECPHCGARQKILENAISFVCKECDKWVNIDK